ncbi:hypothetical protein [Mycobacterium montefiorense]|uniref:Uncharacterized protein n=1 Tax=Mycobacterium montefiorense TaxID=154654 RepID=A0AA37V199_9MYCO|nr:hypothetical protein [Mycobacterium montefiorense]GBG39627.1 hypothetical protein MmonteBS_39990 [Mycobacterium montefiorense]GKU35498.1 hypothetical protein NJB14191_28440 [Mycobacterium montefiorense]GKU40503.1 hypothetical protein NJB14192_24900 [Mycobacterium montefiorense]GKU45006.1 hypothetical protein NJB14194_16300 [Mycobacterium montefiorense]GKU51156.1 hypothetical protein NJB14195_24020 [Mycobacterium montefiorense]
MDVDPYEWGPASVTYPDWQGTVQIDQVATSDLYALTGIDPDEWVIVGLDFGGGKSGMHNPHVIAVRKSELDGPHLSERPHIQAAEIQIHNGVDPFDLLHQIINVMEMRVRVRSVLGATITINEVLDEPPQEMSTD